MSINLAEIQIVVMAHRQPPCSLLLDWLQKLPATHWRRGSQDTGIDLCRNQSVTRFLQEDVPTGKRYLLMFDADMVPIADTNPILHEPGDLLYCGSVGHQGSAGHFSDFGAGCFRVSASLLLKMSQPFFKTLYNEEITRRTACECNWFATNAFAVGDGPKRVGLIGHQQGGDTGAVLFPDNRNVCGWSIAWPAQLGG